MVSVAGAAMINLCKVRSTRCEGVIEVKRGVASHGKAALGCCEGRRFQESAVEARWSKKRLVEKDRRFLPALSIQGSDVQILRQAKYSCFENGGGMARRLKLRVASFELGQGPELRQRKYQSFSRNCICCPPFYLLLVAF
jgi:hypothetical protein